ncbi:MULTISPECIES: hypothetical protein [Nocardioides]|uniref:Chemotaxis methyl-accepting receptor HlyB-like 4HB MCP domain-containing protein n=1 Tax=Nocardioides vastitatis TaxID=2568655 RepID=A0ABW0ZJU5_9ACTN|nr:hypothetical protein [Nocardioides sp.]THJ07036.1 hypothetical protein E7Z54_05690 [Nocardioides sp.]
MSNPIVQQRALAPVTPQPPAATAPAGQVPATQGEPGFVDTPALLNRWQLIGMTTAVVFGLLSALVQFTGWQADGRAAADTDQLVRIQKIQTSLLRADALATNAFLVGGLENSEQRAKYDAEIDDVLSMIADAADAQPADREALATLNEQVGDYASSIAQARANNRQGFPVGAAYQNLGSEQLRTEAIPILDKLVEANTDRAEGAMAGQHPFWLLVLGIVVLVVLIRVNRELAQHFRRRVNKGIAIAVAIVLLVTLVTTLAALARDNSNDSLREGSFAAAVSSATARTAANDAKAQESLRLIKRGSGAKNEEDWGKAAAVVEQNAPGNARTSWRVYADRHQQIVRADEANNWDGAVKIATTADDTGSTAPLEEFDAIAKRAVDNASASAIDDLRSGRVLALVLSALTVLLGIVAAAAVARGIGERRREFS